MLTIELADKGNIHSGDIKFLDQKIFENSFSKIGHYRYEPLACLIRDANKNTLGLKNLGQASIISLPSKTPHLTMSAGFCR